MHRHGYIGRKLGRRRDERRALMKGLATTLVMHSKIETTQPKAKELVRYIEKLITKAKKGGLDNRRRVIAALSTHEAANRLFDVIAPQLTTRSSGHVRVKRTKLRVGDGAQMATIAFVDEINPQKLTDKEVSAGQNTKAHISDNRAKKARPPKLQNEVLASKEDK